MSQAQAIIRFVFHLLWFIPLFYHRYYLAIATLLLVALVYVKTYKLTKQIEELRHRGMDENDIELRKIAKSRAIFKFLTYL